MLNLSLASVAARFAARAVPQSRSRARRTRVSDSSIFPRSSHAAAVGRAARQGVARARVDRGRGARGGGGAAARSGLAARAAARSAPPAGRGDPETTCVRRGALEVANVRSRARASSASSADPPTQHLARVLRARPRAVGEQAGARRSPTRRSPRWRRCSRGCRWRSSSARRTASSCTTRRCGCGGSRGRSSRRTTAQQLVPVLEKALKALDDAQEADAGWQLQLSMELARCRCAGKKKEAAALGGCGALAARVPKARRRCCCSSRCTWRPTTRAR